MTLKAAEEAQEIVQLIDAETQSLRRPSSESIDFRFQVDGQPQDIIEELEKRGNFKARQIAEDKIFVTCLRLNQDVTALTGVKPILDPGKDADQDASLNLGNWSEYYPKGIPYISLVGPNGHKQVFSVPRLLNEGLPSWMKDMKFGEIVVARNQEEAEKSVGVFLFDNTFDDVYPDEMNKPPTPFFKGIDGAVTNDGLPPLANEFADPEVFQPIQDEEEG